MSVQPRLLAVGPADVLATAVRLLAVHGAEAVGEVLTLTRSAVGCAGITLRGPDVAPLTSLRTVPAVPAQDTGERYELDVPVRVGNRFHGVLTATAVWPFDPDQGQLLGAVADLIALALQAAVDDDHDPVAGGWVVLDAEADRAQVAAGL